MQSIHHPEIARVESWDTVSLVAVAAARVILETVQTDLCAHITYATGETMIPVYRTTREIAKREDISFLHTKASHLDEYWPADQCRDNFSFVKYLRERVFGPFQIPQAQRFEMNGTTTDPEQEARRYDLLLSENPVALAILGIGPGCHIGFNERWTSFEQRVHFTRLSEETIQRDHVERGLVTPEHVITQGIGNIMDAQRILMVAFGVKKGKYLQEALYGSISPGCPASALRTVGEKVTIIIDEAASAVLEEDNIYASIAG